MDVIYSGPQPARVICLPDGRRRKAVRNEAIEVPDEVGAELIKQRDWEAVSGGVQALGATPKAIELAKEKGIDIASVNGTLKGGKVSVDDVRTHVAAAPESGESVGDEAQPSAEVLADQTSEEAQAEPESEATPQSDPDAGDSNTEE